MTYIQCRDCFWVYQETITNHSCPFCDSFRCEYLETDNIANLIRTQKEWFDHRTSVIMEKYPEFEKHEIDRILNDVVDQRYWKWAKDFL